MDLFNQTRFPQTDWLASRDSRGAIRLVKLECEWNDSEHAYTIIRTTGQYNKTQTIQPTIFVRKGKVNRTVTEQTRLQYDHLLKEYEDKGYKKLDKSYDLYSESELSEIVGEHKTSKDGLLKPMLAKQYQDIKNTSVFDKIYLGSRKIDGVRCLIYFDGKEIHTKSRRAIDYDFVLDHIISHPLLIKLFKANPDLILDGEIYKHGWTLNRISGICRSQKTAYDGEPLEYYLYDIVDPELSFIDRFKQLIKIKQLLKLDFDPTKEWSEDDLKIQFVPQEKISGLDNMMELHDKYVSEGWEGLVVRLITAKYGPGKRTNDMIKIKNYKSNTCKTIGIEQGLRPYDDMVFIMQMKDGKTFKAKPKGDHSIKVDYFDNFETLYKNKLADIKYFKISPYGIPEQPIFESFRYDISEPDL